MVEYINIGQATLEIDGAGEELIEQSTLPSKDDDMEVGDDINDDNLNADNDDVALLHFRNINNILGAGRFASHALMVEELYMVSSDEMT
jgi:hypothetical protein